MKFKHLFNCFVGIFALVITNYRILSSPNPQVLAKDVRTFIAQGWQPYGPMVASGGVLLQPMVQYTNK